MNTLITSERVLQLAFSPDEMLIPSMITVSDIVEAEYSYLVPILGSALYERLLQGDYPEFVEEYVAPVVAAWVHYIVRPLLGMRSSVCLSVGGDSVSAAELQRQQGVCDLLRHKALTLSRRMSDHLNAHADDYVEYKPSRNLLNRCSIHGGIIQVY